MSIIRGLNDDQEVRTLHLTNEGDVVIVPSVGAAGVDASTIQGEGTATSVATTINVEKTVGGVTTTYTSKNILIKTTDVYTAGVTHYRLLISFDGGTTYFPIDEEGGSMDVDYAVTSFKVKTATAGQTAKYSYIVKI